MINKDILILNIRELLKVKEDIEIGISFLKKEKVILIQENDLIKNQILQQREANWIIEQKKQEILSDISFLEKTLIELHRNIKINSEEYVNLISKLKNDTFLLENKIQENILKNEHLECTQNAFKTKDIDLSVIENKIILKQEKIVNLENRYNILIETIKNSEDWLKNRKNTINSKEKELIIREGKLNLMEENLKFKKERYKILTKK